MPGAFAIELEPIADERGSFARVFSSAEFSKHGLSGAVAECSISYNRSSNTLRGLHYQVAPSQECKLIRCSRGAVFDVLVDLRPDSPAYCRWAGIELDSMTNRVVYVPQGVAHGFLTLSDDSEVSYQISAPYAPHHARGVRWNDPSFAIEWPLPVEIIARRDAEYPDFVP